jgi:hypothetical protein
MATMPVTKALGSEGATRSYTFNFMPATDAWEVMKITKITGSMFGNELDGLNRNDFDIVRDLLLKSVTCVGKSIDNFDAFFTGRMYELSLVLKEAMEVNFADFLAAKKASDAQKAASAAAAASTP